MFRRSRPHGADELRSRFTANRERVRSWTVDWDCPEVEWPDFPDIPRPWSVAPGDEGDWLQRHAPFLAEYSWLLEARPIAQAVTSVHGYWSFGPRHEFQALDIEIRCTVLDPVYLAEKLALGAHAANLDGWREDDLGPLYEWLLDGADTRPPSHMVRGHKRSGFILFEFRRAPRVLEGPGIIAKLTMQPTVTALDGSPLNSEGETI
ncbi:hypothetical protein [Nocardia spumae]|uniref:hypothetical protein n=1 Tax=Nocardia spumae TaxID=2887190 RepID=UPI001D14F763|nr:hypothetical protein [Nocardia spumae]